MSDNNIFIFKFEKIHHAVKRTCSVKLWYTKIACILEIVDMSKLEQTWQFDRVTDIIT